MSLTLGIILGLGVVLLIALLYSIHVLEKEFPEYFKRKDK